MAHSAPTPQKPGGGQVLCTNYSSGQWALGRDKGMKERAVYFLGVSHGVLWGLAGVVLQCVLYIIIMALAIIRLAIVSCHD